MLLSRLVFCFLASQTLHGIRAMPGLEFEPWEGVVPQVTWADTYHMGRHVWVSNSNGVPFVGKAGVK